MLDWKHTRQAVFKTLAATALIMVIAAVAWPMLFAQCKGKSSRGRDAIAKVRPLIARFYAVTGRWPKDYAELASVVPHSSFFSYRDICEYEILGCSIPTTRSTRDDLSNYTLTFDKEESGYAFLYLRPSATSASFPGYSVFLPKPSTGTPGSPSALP